MPRELETLLQQSQVVDLSQPMSPAMPKFFAHIPFSLTLNLRHSDLDIPGGMGMANDVIIGCTHSGTHIDAIGHISHNGCLFGGVNAREAASGIGGLLKCGIEQTPPILRRGVLLDVASFKDVDALEQSHVITADCLEKTAKAEGVELRAGDVVLIRTGWAQYWDTPAKYEGMGVGGPGPDLSAAQWLVAHKASLTGADTMAYEFNTGDGGGAVHGYLLADIGTQIIENLNLEGLAKERIYSFMFFAAPLRIVGATASPIRPVAICS
jgi:kynurenine formamidase